MVHNDNLTPEIQTAIAEQERRIKHASLENRAWWLETLRTHYHPNIQGLPDYGLASLKPETEAYCRALCEQNGFSYEQFKEQFSARTQVIQARAPNPITLQLIERGVCPINDLDAGFKAYVQGGVMIKRRLRAERAMSIQREFESVQ